jgi:hypothetical protein
VSPPFVPVIVIRYTPGVIDEGLHLPVINPVVTLKLVGQLGVSPVLGATVVVRVTMPVNPLIGVTVMVELPVAPVLKSAGVVAVIVKSTKLNVAMKE